MEKSCDNKIAEPTPQFKLLIGQPKEKLITDILNS